MPTTEVAVVLRVLVAIEPQMYREVLVFYFRQQRPLLEIVLTCPQTLQAEAEHKKPHLIFASHVPPELKEMAFWVEVRPANGLVATIKANGGYSTTIEDVSLQELLAVVDKAEEQLAHDEA